MRFALLIVLVILTSACHSDPTAPPSSRGWQDIGTWSGSAQSLTPEFQPRAARWRLIYRITGTGVANVHVGRVGTGGARFWMNLGGVPAPATDTLYFDDGDRPHLIEIGGRDVAWTVVSQDST